MTYPASAPSRYSSSRQLIAGSDINALSDHAFSFQSITVIGANAQATATPINAANVEIAAGLAAGAVKLPLAYPGGEVAVLNNSGNTQAVFPSDLGGNTDVIQNGPTGFGAAGASVNMTNGVNSLYFCIKKGFWQVTKTTGP